MTGAQFQKLLDLAGLKQTHAAEALELDPRTIRKYVLDESPVTRRTAYAVRWLAHAAQNGLNPDTGKPK